MGKVKQAIQELEEKVNEIVQNSEDITLAEVQTILFKKEFFEKKYVLFKK